MRPSEQAGHKDVTEATGNGGQKDSLDPRKLFESLSAVSQQEAEEVAKRLEPPPGAQEEPKVTADPPKANSDGPPTTLIVPEVNRHTIKRKKSKHKHKDQVRKPLFIQFMFFLFHLMRW